jgi:hypothetical protein
MPRPFHPPRLDNSKLPVYADFTSHSSFVNCGGCSSWKRLVSRLLSFCAPELLMDWYGSRQWVVLHGKLSCVRFASQCPLMGNIGTCHRFHYISPTSLCLGSNLWVTWELEIDLITYRLHHFAWVLTYG